MWILYIHDVALYMSIFFLIVFLLLCFCTFFFFFKQKTAYEMRISDWCSDVCSSDLCFETVGPCNCHNVRHDVAQIDPGAEPPVPFHRKEQTNWRTKELKVA